MLERLFAAIERASRGDPGDALHPRLTTAAREIQTLAGADIVVLHLHEGLPDPLVVRVPANAAWPSGRSLHRWVDGVLRQKGPVALTAADRPRRPPIRHGIVLPVLGAGGIVGALGMFSTKRTPFSSGQCAGAMVLIQDAVTRTQALPLRHRNEVKASAEVQGRVAREIHDGPLQTLSGLVLRLRVMRTAGEQGTHEVLRGIEIELDHVIKEMRSLIRNSHVAYSATSLEDRIRETLTRLERTRGFTWALRWRCPEAALPNSTKEELFRVINEALANVYRHSSAKHVDVVGRMRGGALEITVRDDGVGFDVAQVLRQDIRALSFGLTNMRERVSALGGTLLLRSQPGRGARVLISVPLSRPRASKGA